MENSKRRTSKHFLLHNGEMLMRKQIAYWGPRAYPIRIFSERELRTCTDDHSKPMGIRMDKGWLDDRAVAVKLRHAAVKLTQDQQAEWITDEIAILANIRHRNVVRLLGCCLETQYAIPVYEFIAGGRTLHHYLSHLYEDTVLLQWSDRMRIAAEVADALNYLHTHSSMAIIHRNVKPSNILLDESLTAKLSGFEDSLLMPADRKQDSETDIIGTRGYIDPEYLKTRVANEKSDVFSLGVVMLELLTGKTNSMLASARGEFRSILVYFTSYQKKGRIAEILDSSIVCEGTTNQIGVFCNIASKCINSDRIRRPTMKEVVQELRQIRKM